MSFFHFFCNLPAIFTQTAAHPTNKGAVDMKWKILFLWISVLVSFSGCHQVETPKPTRPLCTYITQIDVFYQQSGNDIHLQFTDDKRIEPVLHYLRLLKNYGDADNEPALSDVTEYRLILTASDGTQQLFRQKGAACLSWDDAAWQVLDPRQAQLLAPLLRLLSAEYVF